MGNASWKYDELAEPIAMTADQFSDVFVLNHHNMSYGHYWVTQALSNVEPEYEDGDLIGDDNE
jgi:hypothetical protein